MFPKPSQCHVNGGVARTAPTAPDLLQLSEVAEILGRTADETRVAAGRNPEPNTAALLQPTTGIP